MVSTAPMPAPRPLFEAAVQDLRQRGAIEGALLVSRDGFLLAGECPGVTSTEVFSAMHATALGAAEIALHSLGAQRGVTLIAEIGGRRFLSRGINESMFVVAVIRDGGDCHGVFTWMEDLGRQLGG